MGLPACAGSVSMPDEVMIKIWSLDLAEGNLPAAQKIYEWLNPHNKVVPAAKLTQALDIIRKAKGIPSRVRFQIDKQLKENGLIEDED